MMGWAGAIAPVLGVPVLVVKVLVISSVVSFPSWMYMESGTVIQLVAAFLTDMVASRIKCRALAAFLM